MSAALLSEANSSASLSRRDFRIGVRDQRRFYVTKWVQHQPSLQGDHRKQF
jgi:hypothetical protein